VTAASRRLHPVEWVAFTAVWAKELTLFRRYWRSTTFSAVLEPTVYLLAFGVGIGSLVATVNGIRYVEFLGTGVVATAVLFTSAFAGMFTTFVRRVYQRSYDAMLAAPVDVHELVLAEATWIATKAGVYGCAPLLVAIGFGLTPSWGMLLVPFVGVLTGLGFAMFGIWVSAIVPAIDSFNYVISAVLTPLFLVSGTFFPISGLPSWLSAITVANPLYHCVELVRHCAFGLQPVADTGHVAALAVFAAAMAAGAIRRMRRRLID
jgi:lipooligosaccharide transport system permease protein